MEVVAEGILDLDTNRFLGKTDGRLAKVFELCQFVNIGLGLDGTTSKSSIDDHQRTFRARGSWRNILSDGPSFSANDQRRHFRGKSFGRAVEENEIARSDGAGQQIGCARGKDAGLDGDVHTERNRSGI